MMTLLAVNPSQVMTGGRCEKHLQIQCRAYFFRGTAIQFDGIFYHIFSMVFPVGRVKSRVFRNYFSVNIVLKRFSYSFVFHVHVFMSAVSADMSAKLTKTCQCVYFSWHPAINMMKTGDLMKMCVFDLRRIFSKLHG